MTKIMKQPTSAFSFKKNTDVSALPEAKPEPVVPKQIKKTGKAKPGRKPESDEGARKKQVSGYLTEGEFEKFEKQLDGRPASAIVRKLILDYSDNG